MKHMMKSGVAAGKRSVASNASPRPIRVTIAANKVPSAVMPNECSSSTANSGPAIVRRSKLKTIAARGAITSSSSHA